MRVIEELLRQPPRADMLPDFIVSRAALLSGTSGAEATRAAPDVAAIRRQVVEALGLERIPASNSVEVVGRTEWSDHAVEKLVFEATPGLPVPALLYVPRGDGPHPAVVHAPGHWMEDAKLSPDVQRLNLHLVRNGIAVLCYDTLGQGERRIGWHQHGQLAPLLVGFTTLGLMVRDSIAALDLLEARPDIDAERLGMAGASGGGFSTIFTATLDERVRAAAIGCIVNTHVSQIRDAAFGTGWDSWVDLCNQVPGLCAIGSMGEIMAVIGPRDLLIANAEEDPGFPLEGAREVATEVRLHYEALEAADRFSYVEVPGGHGLHRAMRTTMAGFLSASLGVVDKLDESESVPFTPQWAVTHEAASAEQPQSTKPVNSNGTCLRRPIDSNDPVVHLARLRAALVREDRKPLTACALRSSLGPFPQRTPLDARVTNHIATRDGFAQRLVLTSEPGIELDCLFLLPHSWSDHLAPVLVVLDEGGKNQALCSKAAAYAREHGCAVLLPDLRGTGESAASEFEVATAAWMLDRDLLNQRVWDVLRVVDWLSGRYSTGQQIDKGHIVLWGAEAFGLVALLAGALDSRVAAVGATGIGSLEDLLVRDARVTPMAYRYRLLETLDLADLQDIMAPRPAHVGLDAADAEVLATLLGHRAGDA
jgi:dienelactone hydrolase